MTDEPYVITVTDNVDKAIKSELNEIGKAAKAAYSELQIMQKAVDGLQATQIKSVNSEMKELRRSVDDLSQGQARLNNTVQNFTPAIEKAEKATRKSKSTIKDTATEVDTLGGSLASLNKIARTAFLGLGTLFIGRSVIQAIQQYDELRGRLSSVITEANGLKEAVAGVGQTASQTGIGIQSLGDFLAQVSTRNKEYGVTAQGAMNATEALALAVSMSGKTIAEQGKGVEAFGKALANGNVKTQEFRNLLIQFPQVLAVLKQAFGQDVFEGLRTGIITAEQVVKTLGGSVERLRKDAANAPVSIGQAWAILKETWNAQVNGMDQATGASRLLASGILLIARNMDTLIPLVAAFGLAWGVVGIGNIVVGIAGLASGLVKLAIPLAALAIANPFTAMLIAITALVLGIAYFTGSLEPAVAKIKEVASGAAKFVSELLGIDPATTSVDQLTSAAGNTDKQFVTAKGSADTMKGAIVSAGTDGSKSVLEIGKAADATTSDLKAATSQANSLADALDAAADAAKRLKAAQGGSSSGAAIAGKQHGGSFMAGRPDIPRYANGASFQVGGKSGIDNNLVSFMASGNEKVTVETPAQQRASEKNSAPASRGDTTINLILPGVTDADSFRRSQGQITSDIAGGILKALSNG